MAIYAIQKISTGFILNYTIEYFNESAPEMCTLVDYETTEGIWVTSDEKRAKEVLYFSNSVYGCNKELPRHSLNKEDLQVIKLTLENKLPNVLLEFNSLEAIENYMSLNKDSLDETYIESIQESILETKENSSMFKALQDTFLHYLFWSNLI
jgi:hypothetical protein